MNVHAETKKIIEFPNIDSFLHKKRIFLTERMQSLNNHHNFNFEFCFDS